MMRVAEVAEKLQVSLSIVYALIEAGKLACYRIGLGRGCIRVREEDLEMYLASSRCEPATDPPVRRRGKLKHIQL